MNGIVRPFRPASVYSATCLECGTEIESVTPDVPFLCGRCQKKQDDKRK